MNPEQTRGAALPSWFVPVIAVAALVLATAALTATLVGRGTIGGAGMMGGGGMMAGRAGAYPATGPQPGDAGFAAGTVASPRTIRIYAGPGLAFNPATVAVTRGETIRFEITTMGPAVHEFMVGSADAVATDMDGTPEVADIGMMQTKMLTITFDGSGPYAYACHVDGHYEAGMRGTVVVVG